MLAYFNVYNCSKHKYTQVNIQETIEENSTHKSVMTHAGNVFVPRGCIESGFKNLVFLRFLNLKNLKKQSR